MKNVSWITLVVGIWLVLAPFIVRATVTQNAWTANDIALGIVLIATSWWILAAMAPPLGIAWFQILCGLWLIVAPFVLGYRALGSPMVSDVTAGIISIIVAATTARAITRTPTAA